MRIRNLIVLILEIVLKGKMKSKYAKFAKNMGLAAVAAVAGGVAGAELTDLVTNSEVLIATGSTAGQYLASFGVFLPLHARDNPDLYRDEQNKFKWSEYTKDMIRMTVGFGVLDYLYLAGRPAVNYFFQKKGYDPTTASLLSDAVCIPSYCIVAIPMARGLGVIKEKKPKNQIEGL